MCLPSCGRWGVQLCFKKKASSFIVSVWISYYASIFQFRKDNCFISKEVYSLRSGMNPTSTGCSWASWLVSLGGTSWTHINTEIVDDRWTINFIEVFFLHYYLYLQPRFKPSSLLTNWMKVFFLHSYFYTELFHVLQDLRRKFSLLVKRQGFDAFTLSSMATIPRISRASFSLFFPRILMFCELAVHRHSRK